MDASRARFVLAERIGMARIRVDRSSAPLHAAAVVRLWIVLVPHALCRVVVVVVVVDLGPLRRLRAQPPR